MDYLQSGAALRGWMRRSIFDGNVSEIYVFYLAGFSWEILFIVTSIFLIALGLGRLSPNELLSLQILKNLTIRLIVCLLLMLSTLVI
jgi:hypothetical protein